MFKRLFVAFVSMSLLGIGISAAPAVLPADQVPAAEAAVLKTKVRHQDKYNMDQPIYLLVRDKKNSPNKKLTLYPGEKIKLPQKYKYVWVPPGCAMRKDGSHFAERWNESTGKYVRFYWQTTWIDFSKVDCGNN